MSTAEAERNNNEEPGLHGTLRRHLCVLHVTKPTVVILNECACLSEY